MISANFFEQNMTEANVNEFTDIVQNLQLSEFSNAYWLGWISWENIPSMYHLSECALTSSGLTFTDVTPAQNCNVGIMPFFHASASLTYSSVITKQGGVYLAPWYNLPRFANKWDIMGTGFNGSMALWIKIAINYGTDPTALNQTSFREMSLTNYTHENFRNFINGDSTIEIGFQGGAGGSVITVQLDINNIMDDNTFRFSETNVNGSTTYYNDCTVFFSGFTFNCQRTIISNVYGGYDNPSTVIDLTVGENEYIAPAIITGDSYLTVNNNSLPTVSTTNFYGQVYNTDNLFFGGLNGTIPTSFFNAVFYAHLIAGNMCALKYSSNIRIYRIFNPREIYKNYCLGARSYNNLNVNVYGYTAGNVYATHVTEENEFLAELITGDLDDPDFVAQLRPWQYDVNEWAENEYTEEDLPPYEPTEGDDVSSSGDENLPNLGISAGNATGFLTLYAMNEYHMQKFGSILWANIFSGDFWRSVYTTIANDFSIHPSDILNYIVSLHCFPFDLSTCASYASRIDTLYVGVGTAGLSLLTGYDIGIMESFGESFDGGTLAVPRKFNDFRDYEPYSTVHIFIPFCGEVELTPSEVVGKTLRLSYCVDLSTGAVQASVYVLSEVSHMVATASGTIGASIALTASNASNTLVKAGTSIAQMVAAVAAIATGTEAVQAGAAMEGAGGDAMIRQGIATQNQGFANMSQVPGTLLESNPTHTRNTVSGFGSFQTTNAYITIVYKHYQIPQNFAHTYGYATNITKRLGDLDGFTVCSNPDLTGLTATGEEKAIIAQILTTGIFL